MFKRKAIKDCKEFSEFCASHTCNVYGEYDERSFPEKCPLLEFQQPNEKPESVAHQKPSDYLSKVNLECEKEFNRRKSIE